MDKFFAPQLLPGLFAADVINVAANTNPTYRVRLTIDGKNPPSDFIAALVNAGFNHGPMPPADTIGEYLVVADFSKVGNAPFGRWTAAQLKDNHATLQSIFEAAGLPFAPRPARSHEVG